MLRGGTISAHTMSFLIQYNQRNLDVFPPLSIRGGQGVLGLSIRIYNDQKLKSLRRDLRNNQTEAEEKVWSRIRAKQVRGLRFHRQYSVGLYILDFYCPKLRLAIEIDGGQHSDSQTTSYDEKRTSYLREHNIKVLRYWNHEVLTQIEDVVADITNTCT